MASFRENPPLAGHYWPTLAVVLLALCPDIVVATAYHFLVPAVTAGLHASAGPLHTAEGLSNAGYAFGAIIAGFLIQRFPQRSLFLAAEAAFVVASILCAVAPLAVIFAAGRILQGLATGVLLVVAIPPLVTRFPARRLPFSAAIINIAFFGAVTAGPLVGAVVIGRWRWFFAGLAGLGVIGLAIATFTFPLQSAQDPDHPPDWPAFIYALLGTMLPFYAVAQLNKHTSFGAPIFWAPMAVGLACLVALIVTQYRAKDGLIPMHKIWHAVPLAGTLCAMIAGAAYVTLLLLGEMFLENVRQLPAPAVGLAQWPGVIALLIAALVFWRLFATKHLPWLILAGMALLLAAGSALVTVSFATSLALLLGITAALGAGAGATVSPGLFMAAFAVESSFLGRVFGLVELVRSEADFLIAPTMQHIATLRGKTGAALLTGIHEAAWIILGVTLLGLAGMAALYLGSGTRPQRPDIEGWLGEGRPALHSAAVGLHRRR